jgi:hypothetical protein
MNDRLAYNQHFSRRANPVFAGGNSNDEGAFTNTDGFIMSRFTIAVGGVDKARKHAGYSVSNILQAKGTERNGLTNIYASFHSYIAD